MRRLLIKLVAIETMLVGWLSYWIFLVYANNTTVSAGLSDQLARFPQLAFTTIDIAVLVIIAAFAVTLAFKFHRGLRPGIRLERALQMLENLMKRNLLLEAQVAELRVEKVERTRPVSLSPPSSAPTISGLGISGSASSMSELRAGSWERAFKTPLEAGPPIKSQVLTPSSMPFRETGIPPPRIEPVALPPSPLKESATLQEKPGISLPVPGSTEKTIEKSSALVASESSKWEQSPRYIGESTGVLTPSNAKKPMFTSTDSTDLRQPYIPVPASKMPPPSVIVGPMNQRPSSPTRQTPRPIVRPSFSTKQSSKDPPIPSLSETKLASPPIVIDKSETLPASPPIEPLKLSVSTEEPTREKTSEKSTSANKKKAADYEEE